MALFTQESNKLITELLTLKEIKLMIFIALLSAPILIFFFAEEQKHPIKKEQNRIEELVSKKEYDKLYDSLKCKQ